MTVYLVDENVLREFAPGGNAHVRAWRAGVDDLDLRISVMTFFEKRRGWERRRRSDPDRAAKGLAALDALQAAFRDRTVAIDEEIVAEWARLLGAKDKNQRDMALAATARVRGFVLVTRNVEDFRGRGVQVLNPFKTPSVIEAV